ncbi:protein of unknown function [Xenorhabdus nematophila AN6/1]|nr:protein of unknown function [Xenorhabdus nematophila AN6/1]
MAQIPGTAQSGGLYYRPRYPMAGAAEVNTGARSPYCSSANFSCCC